MSRVALAICMVIVVAACTVPKRVATPPPKGVMAPVTLSAAQIEAIRQGVGVRLKDPESARLGRLSAGMLPKEGNLREESGIIAVCGFVNAKNSYDGYVGQMPFSGFLTGAGDVHIFALSGIATRDTEAWFYRDCRVWGLRL